MSDVIGTILVGLTGLITALGTVASVVVGRIDKRARALTAQLAGSRAVIEAYTEREHRLRRQLRRHGVPLPKLAALPEPEGTEHDPDPPADQRPRRARQGAI